MKSPKENDVTVPVEFDNILAQVLDNHGLTFKAKDDPSLSICPFRDPTKPYCKYKQTLSASKECEDYCRLEFQTCPTYQQYRLLNIEREFIKVVVDECLIYGIDFNRAERRLQKCFVTMELTNKKRGDYERVEESVRTNPLHSVGYRIVDGRNNGGLIKNESRHNS